MLAAALMLSFTYSCDEPSTTDPDDQEQNGGNDENNENNDDVDFMATSPFTITAEEVTPIGFTLDVDAGEYEDLYYVALMTKYDYNEVWGYSDYDAMAAGFLTLLVEDQLIITDFSQVNGLTIFQGNNKVEMRTAWKHLLYPDTELIAFVFGVDDYGTCIAKPAFLELKTEPKTVPIEAGYTVELDEDAPSSTSFTVNVTPEAGAEDKAYIVAAFQAKELAEGGYYERLAVMHGTDPLYEAANDMLIVKRWTVDFTDVDNVDLFQGSQSMTITQSDFNNAIVPNADYAVIAYGVDEYGYVSTGVGLLEVTSDKMPQVDISFEVVFDETAYTDSGFSFTVTPSRDDVPYYCNIYAKAAIDNIGGAEADPEAICKLFQDFGIQYNLRRGEFSITYEGLSLYTDFYVVLFGYNGGMTSGVTLIECRTGSYRGDEE